MTAVGVSLGSARACAVAETNHLALISAPLLQKPTVMLGRRPKTTPGRGTVDGGAGRGVPLGGRDERPPTGYRSEDDENDVVVDGGAVEELLWDDGDPADRRRDPLRRP